MKGLPPYIVKKNRFFYINTLTGKYIHKDNIAMYVASLQPKELTRWDLKYDNY